MAILTEQPPLIEDLSRLEALVPSTSEASYSTKDDETAFVSLFESIWARAPASWKERCKTRILPPKRPRDRLRIDLWKKDAITIPKFLRVEVAKWKADPSSFFLITFTTTPTTDPFCQLARLLHCTLGGDPIIRDIRTRIGCIALHRLRTSLGRRRLRTGTDTEDEFNKRMNAEHVFANLAELVANGGKYDSLSQDLGGVGSMVCWPPDVSEAKLQRISPEGPNRTMALQCLHARGIDDHTNDDIKLCDDAAKGILSVMEKNMQSFFQQYCVPTSALDEDTANESQKQDFSVHKSSSRKRKRGVMVDTSADDTSADDTSAGSPMPSTALRSLHSTPQESTFECAQAVPTDTAALGYATDVELDLLNRSTEPSESFRMALNSVGSIDMWDRTSEPCDSADLSFDPSAHFFDPASDYLFLNQESHLRCAGAQIHVE